MDVEDLLKVISLERSREILQQLSYGPKTATELREECEKLKNRVSFYKSLNRMAKLRLVKKYRDPELKTNVYGLEKSRILVNLKRTRSEWNELGILRGKEKESSC